MVACMHACVCVKDEGRGQAESYSVLPTPLPRTSRYQSKLWPWGSLASQAPFSTRETKRGAASLHRIKQSLNASSCYTLPNETFIKGPLMWFQKHLVIIPGAAHLRRVDVWMNASAPLRWAAVPTVLLAGVHLANIACGFIPLLRLRMTAWALLGSEERTQRTWTKAYLCSHRSACWKLVSQSAFEQRGCNFWSCDR